jgi:ABC-type multidrug transport system permease subunit
VAADFNPYQAPAAPIVEEFIAVDPPRRWAVHRMAAALCLGCAGFSVTLVGTVVFLLVYPPPGNPPAVGKGILLLVPLVGSLVAFLSAGLAFWRRRDRRGVVQFVAGIGSFASIYLLPHLIR